MTGSIGRRYARALLALARDEGRLEAAGGELAAVAAVFADERLAALVGNPTLGASGRRDIAERVLAAVSASTTVGNLVRLLAERERLAELPDVARAYASLVDRELGRVQVAIRSATALSDAVREELAAITRRLSGKDVVVSSEVDPELLGGIVLDVGGTVYDGSVRTQLERMKRSMTEGGR